MTRAVERLVSRGLRPPVSVSARVVGPTVVDIESPIAAAAEPPPSRGVRPIDPTTVTAPGGEPAAMTYRRTHIAAADTDAAVATPAARLRSTSDDVVTRPAATSVASAHGETPSRSVQPDRPERPGSSTAPPSPVDPVHGGEVGRTSPRGPANPIAARLETALLERALPEPHVPEHIVTAQLPGTGTDRVLVGVGPGPSEPAEATRDRAHSLPRAPHDTAPQMPSVTIGTIEVVTPAAAPPAPRPLDVLAPRRRAGRARWTGRAG